MVIFITFSYVIYTFSLTRLFKIFSIRFVVSFFKYITLSICAIMNLKMELHHEENRPRPNT